MPEKPDYRRAGTLHTVPAPPHTPGLLLGPLGYQSRSSTIVFLTIYNEFHPCELLSASFVEGTGR